MRPKSVQKWVCQKAFYRVERKEISFIKFIFEAYEGIAVLRTADAENGIIMLLISPGCIKTVDNLLKDLSRSIRIEPAHAI